MAKAKKAANAFIDLVTPNTPKTSPLVAAKEAHAQQTRMGDVGFDPRFEGFGGDPRVGEMPKLGNLTTTVEKQASQEIPSVYLPDYEGYGYVSSMSDRTAGGGNLISINGLPLKRPVDLQGGQSYMFENPGQVWASGDTPARAIMMQAAAAKALTGKDPLYLPWRMAPTGSDFATMTGETMLSFAESNMGRDTKKTLNNQIKEFIPNWKGIDSPKSIDQFRSAPDATRKAIHAMMDKEFRNEGGLGIGEARLSIADPEQLNAPVGYLMNVGKIFADQPLLQQSGHASYPRGVPGEGIGRIGDERSLFELYPKTFPEEGKEKVIRPLLLDPATALTEYNNLPNVVESRNIADPKTPSFNDTRALQMKPYYGILTEEILRKMGYAHGGIIHKVDGGMVDSVPEEAIKNTIKDPQAFNMLDMDLAKLALLNQQQPQAPRRMADGGILDGHPVFQTAQVPFAEYRHSIGMNHGGAHFDEGGQASLDQMRYELANSPVMQATPRSPVQDFIGTIGGYMDKAGHFISNSIEPLAETHPRQHFIANMMMADPLKSAGTLMQDLTGTVRETDEDNPVRGIIDKNWKNLSNGTEPLLDPRALDLAGFVSPVVKGVTKLAGAGAKAITPFAKSTAEMAAELYGRGQMPGMVAPNAYMAEPSVPKPTRALAPANEQGFYSPTEAAALNLQRKSGNGQAFLNDIMKGENVKPEEISGMGLDTFLKDKKNVTAAEVQDFIAQNKLGLGEQVYRKQTVKWGENDDGNLVTQNTPTPYTISSEYGKTYVTDINDNTFPTTFKSEDDAKRFVEKMAQDEGLLPNNVKYKDYSLPGGENYREVVITMPDPKDALMDQIKALGITKNKTDRISVNDILQRGGSDELAESWKKAMTDPYRSSHFDEPNILAHLRMSDRVTDGKKTLLVDEVQSDWHQAGRERGYKDPQAEKAYEIESKAIADERKNLVAEFLEQEKQNGFVSLKSQKKWDEFKEKENALQQKGKELSSAVPNAPYKEDWYQLALRRAVKEAIDGGYDRVALPTGARVADRFDLSKQIDRIDYRKTPDGTYAISAIKDGKKVFSKGSLDEKELAGTVGKDVAQKIVGGEGSSYGFNTGANPTMSLKGLDLQVGGEGMKKYYDEIYPGYLKKFGKKYGATVGSTTVDAGGVAEPLHYMDITPAMRKEFSTGIHMKKGGKVSFANSLNAMRHELSKAK
jgi:hypothetical protein